MGLIAGVLYSFGGFFYELFTNSLNAGTVLGFGALIGMPAIAAAFGSLVGLIEALLYNLVGGRFGGTDLDFGRHV